LCPLVTEENEVDELFAYPATTIAHSGRRLGVTYRSAQLNIQKLVRAGILSEKSGHKRNRLYIAPEIVSIIEEEEA